MAPQSIPSGSNYSKEIPQAIKNCSLVVLALSEKAQESVWISKEIKRAINYRKIIVPVAIESCAMTDEFNFLLEDSQRMDAYINKSKVMQELVERVTGIIR